MIASTLEAQLWIIAVSVAVIAVLMLVGVLPKR